MPAEDSARAARFYGAAFGWTAEHMGEEMLQPNPPGASAAA